MRASVFLRALGLTKRWGVISINMAFLWLALGAQLISPARMFALENSEILRLYGEGEAAFRQANELAATNPDDARGLYQKAVLAFERIAREGGVENGKLYYNIGNTYFRLGDIGRAILSYRRAERLTPSDNNLQQNLSYARSRRIDKIDERPRAQILKTIFFWHYDLSPHARVTLFAVFFNTIWICAGVYLFKKNAWIRYGILAGAALSMLIAGSLGVEALEECRKRSGVILADEVVARKGDSFTYQPSFKEPLHAGTEFVLTEERKGWYNIELDDGRRCWIPSSAAGLVTPLSHGRET